MEMGSNSSRAMKMATGECNSCFVHAEGERQNRFGGASDPDSGCSNNESANGADDHAKGNESSCQSNRDTEDKHTTSSDDYEEDEKARYRSPPKVPVVEATEVVVDEDYAKNVEGIPLAEIVESRTAHKFTSNGQAVNESFFNFPARNFEVGSAVDMWQCVYEEAEGAASTNRWLCRPVSVGRPARILSIRADGFYDVQVEASKKRYGEPAKNFYKVSPMLLREKEENVQLQDWYRTSTRVLCAVWNGEVKGCESIVRRGCVVKEPVYFNKEWCVDISYFEYGDHIEFSVPIRLIGIDPVYYNLDLPPP